MVHSIYTVFMALFTLGFLVFIHEMGHYIVAKRVGMKVETFSIGFGKLFSWKRKGVTWQIGWIPFGGFVKIAGMEKKGALDLPDIPGGFFHARPIDRIKVALAGPIVNILFALLLFTIIWLGGGRLKSFAEYTHLIGGLKTESGLYAGGVRVGDSIARFNGKAYDGFMQLQYALVFQDGSEEIDGHKISYATGEQTPFTAKYLPGDIIGPASYLKYPSKKIPSQTPEPVNKTIATSGIMPGDRLLAADGDILFSLPQLSTLLNDNHAYVTFARGAQKFSLRIPKIAPERLRLTGSEKVRFEGQKVLLPFLFDEQMQIKEAVPFFNENLQETSFSAPKMAPFTPEIGDKLLAVDGSTIASENALLQALLSKSVTLIVGRFPDQKAPLWTDADSKFTREINWSAISTLKEQVGAVSIGNYAQLNPITAGPVSALYTTAEGVAFVEKYKLAEDKTLRLGISLTDEQVIYNPQPFALFGSVLLEIKRTFFALFRGAVSPSNLAGPLGIVQVMGYGWSVGVFEALYWISLISLNLGILNLLPIPVLDGGHVGLSVYEMVSKRKIKAKMLERLIFPFVILLIAFFVFVTYHDLLRLIKRFF